MRERQFPTARQGLDPYEVEVFLRRAADELAELRAELAVTQDETVRITNALRDWQARYRPVR